MNEKFDLKTAAQLRGEIAQLEKELADREAEEAAAKTHAPEWAANRMGRIFGACVSVRIRNIYIACLVFFLIGAGAGAAIMLCA